MVAVVASFTADGSELRQRRISGMVEAKLRFVPWIAATMAHKIKSGSRRRSRLRAGRIRPAHRQPRAPPGREGDTTVEPLWRCGRWSPRRDGGTARLGEAGSKARRSGRQRWRCRGRLDELGGRGGRRARLAARQPALAVPRSASAPTTSAGGPTATTSLTAKLWSSAPDPWLPSTSQSTTHNGAVLSSPRVGQRARAVASRGVVFLC